MLGVETLLAGIEAGHAGLEGREVALGALGAGDGLLASLAQPPDLVGGRGRPGPQRVDLAVEAGEALAAVGRGAQQPGDPALLLGGGVLGCPLAGQGLLERGAQTLDLHADGLLLLANPDGFGLERVGVAPAGRLDLVGAGGVAHPLVGERLGAAQPLAQAGQREPRLLGSAQRRQVLAQGLLERRLGLARLGQRGLDLGASLDEDRLVGHLLLERGPGGDEVVGHQPRARIAHGRLDSRRLARDLGLAPQRLELAADLGEQVLEPGQVAVRGVELAERLLLALAVLEDAGGLLDEAAPVLRRRVQDLVELALADDHVHLAADAGVAQQLLDVEQPAGRAVDGVLRPARAEHRPADRDLGVLDRQRSVGVVDREQHLRTAERRAPGRAGEDDVLHLAAAQALGALLAHHPGEGVDDVGLARAVGARRCR